MADATRWQQMAAITEVARRYRDAMRQYMAEQTAMINRGVPLDELVVSNWGRFAETQAAEDELFALIDALDEQSQSRS